MFCIYLTYVPLPFWLKSKLESEWSKVSVSEICFYKTEADALLNPAEAGLQGISDGNIHAGCFGITKATDTSSRKGSCIGLIVMDTSSRKGSCIGLKKSRIHRPARDRVLG